MPSLCVLVLLVSGFHPVCVAFLCHSIGPHLPSGQRSEDFMPVVDRGNTRQINYCKFYLSNFLLLWRPCLLLLSFSSFSYKNTKKNTDHREYKFSCVVLFHGEEILLHEMAPVCHNEV